MVNYSRQFPDRYFDVGIAEQHAVTLAAGFACEGIKPVVAIYSTFLQRAYDQLIHDVAIQNLDVTFALDRAGLVGEDGPTHAGSFDLAYLRCVPNIVIATPSDEMETRLLLSTAYKHCGPSAVRYPRGSGIGIELTRTLDEVPLGKGLIKARGSRVAVLCFGVLLNNCLKAAESLDITIADMRFVKPLDEDLIRELANSHDFWLRWKRIRLPAVPVPRSPNGWRARTFRLMFVIWDSPIGLSTTAVGESFSVKLTWIALPFGRLSKRCYPARTSQPQHRVHASLSALLYNRASPIYPT